MKRYCSRLCLFSRSESLKSRILILILITLINFLFGILLISSVISYAEKHSKSSINQPEISNSKNDIIVDSPRTHSSIDITQKKHVNQDYEYYFRIDYTILQSSCKSLQLFNLTKNINSIEDLTYEKMSMLLSSNVSFDIDIISINPILIKTDKIRQNGLHRNSRFVCDYLLELYIGFSCQSNFTPQFTFRSRPFGDPIEKPFSFLFNTENSHRSIVHFNINRMLIFQTTKYFQKTVYISSFDSSRFVSALITDSAASYSSITMSINDRSLFEIKTGLDENRFEEDLSLSSILISFLLSNTHHSYLRHESARIKLGKNTNESLFKQDATFRLLISKTNQKLLAFESINLPQHFIGVDQETQTAIVLIQPNQFISDIDLLEKRFLFKFIEN